ncbi:MAG: hypothetical protein IKO01_04790 [Kiritimatiellae bacterium]|nr:hypothetical protein [Kiritimatiellia bacterium]
MNTHLSNVLDNTGRALGAIGGAVRDINAAGGRNAPLVVLALTPAVLAAFAVTEIGAWAIGELRRRARLRERRPESPSLRGTPTPADLEDLWTADPRTLETRLRLGSRLADLDPTLDRTIARRTLRNGKTVIRSNPGGVKQWLSDRRVAVPYSTVMRYKKTAQRLRQLLSLDDRIPLEWVMDGIPADRSLPTALAAPFSTARHRLAAILRENRSLASLVRTVEAKLGIVRLVTVRRGRGRRRAGAENRREHTCFSGISHEWSAHATEERTEATKAAILRVLAEENPDGRVLHLQHRLRHWLSTLERRRPPER